MTALTRTHLLPRRPVNPEFSPAEIADYDQKITVLNQVVDKLVRLQSAHAHTAECGPYPFICIEQQALDLMERVDIHRMRLLLLISIERLAQHERDRKK